MGLSAEDLDVGLGDGMVRHNQYVVW